MKIEYDIEKVRFAYSTKEEGGVEPCLLYVFEQNGNKRYKNLVSASEDTARIVTHAEARRIISEVDFKKYLESLDLDALLYDANFKLKPGITSKEAVQIFNMIRFSRYLDEQQRNQLREMCSAVSAYCILKLNVPKNKQKEFDRIFKKYLMSDAIASSRSSANWFVTKEDEVIDYKLLRTFKGCGLNLDKLRNADNFKVRVSNENIFIKESGSEEQIIYGDAPIKTQFPGKIQ